MLKTINYDEERTKKYILPSCMQVELEWKNRNCYSEKVSKKNEGKMRIKGVKYCKEEFSKIFSAEDKILYLDNSDYLSECKEKKDIFAFNENLEMRMYGLILKKYYQIIEKNVRNLYFFLHYYQFLKNHASIFGEYLDNFKKEFDNYQEIAVYLKSKTYEINRQENTRYLNEIVSDFLEEKETSEFEEIEKKGMPKHNKNNLIKNQLSFKQILANSSQTANQTIIQQNITKSIDNATVINQTNATLNNSNSNSSNITQILKNYNVSDLIKLVKMIANSTLNLTNLTHMPFQIVNKTASQGFTDDKIIREFKGSFCPEDSICLLKKEIVDYLSTEIIDEYLVEESIS